MAAGVGAKAIAHRIDVGRLHPVHRGVYTVRHRVLGILGQWLAAVSACGEGAALSHRSAAAAWKIQPLGDALPIDLIVAGGAGHKRRGIVAHRDRLHRRDVTALGAIPLTTPSRTLVDVAATARSDRQIYHDTPSRRARDARRDALLRRWRYQVIRVSEADVRERPRTVAQLVTGALS